MKITLFNERLAGFAALACAAAVFVAVAFDTLAAAAPRDATPPAAAAAGQ